MHARLLALLFTLTVATSAHAADVKVTFQSDPPGATLYTVLNDTPRLWGYAPIVMKWGVPKKWTTCLQTEPILVRWLSGAEARIDTLRLCPQVGKNQQFSFIRPTGVPGVEIDGQFAVQILQQRAPAPVIIPPYVPPAQTHCTSQIIGRRVVTNCY